MSNKATWPIQGEYVSRDVRGDSHRVEWTSTTIEGYTDDPGYTFHNVEYASSFGVKGCLVTSHDVAYDVTDNAQAWLDRRTFGDCRPVFDPSVIAGLSAFAATEGSCDIENVTPGQGHRALLRAFKACADGLVPGAQGPTFGPDVVKAPGRTFQARMSGR